MFLTFRHTIFFLFFWAGLIQGQNTSELVYLDQGKLVYSSFSMSGQSNKDNTIPDFSNAGFKGGGISIPSDIPVIEILSPEKGDDADRIQNAIDLVGDLEPDADGYRGVVLLKSGHYSLDKFLLLRNSGVILRGEGQGLDGTVLHSNLRSNHSVISILGYGGVSKDLNTETNIITPYVGVGSISFQIEDASLFSEGDKIVVTRTPNLNWIYELGMDQETLCGGASGCNGWTPSEYTIDHERTITSITDNTITIDIPIVDVIEEAYGGGTITRISSSKRVSLCGIENLRIQSFYNNEDDESHAWTGVKIKDAENCWVKQVTGQYLAYSTVNIEKGNFCSIQDCAYIDPISKVTGGRRYSFAIQKGLGNLFQRCYAENGRHDYVTGSRVTGPNVFLDVMAENANSDIGPHHRWATGTLFDNVFGGSTRVWNRGSSGTGHGWSGAQTMFWNIASYGGEFRVDSPLGSRNWGIGCTGNNQKGDGYWEHWGSKVQPRSLYIQQLKDRLGEEALNNVLIERQETNDIYDLLATWKGYGNFYDGGANGKIPTIEFEEPDWPLDVSTWEGGDIIVEAKDEDGMVQKVELLINGEPVAVLNEAPYIFSDLTNVIQGLSHQTHYLQAKATDNDGNTNITRLKIIGGEPLIIEEEAMNSNIKVFPNPSIGGKLTIQMKTNDLYSVRLYDMFGRKVDEFRFNGLEFRYQNGNRGIYLLEIINKDNVIFKQKIIIH